MKLTLPSILQLITAPKAARAADLRQAKEALDIAGAEAAIDRLEERRRGMLLKSTDAELEGIETEIRAASRELDRRHAAAKELDRLIAEALDREKLAETESQGAEALAAQSRAVAAYIKLDSVACQLSELLADIRAAEQTIAAANAHVIAAGRHDLRAKLPIGLLSEITGLPPERLPDLQRWRLHGYLPAPDSPAMAIDRRFGRFTDMGAISLRKAA